MRKKQSRTVDVSQVLREKLRNARGPVVPLSHEGAHPSTQWIAYAVFGAFAAGAAVFGLLVLFVMYSMPREGGYVLLGFSALIFAVLVADWRKRKREGVRTAESLFGGRRSPEIQAAVERFRAATDVPLCVAVRNHVPGIAAGTLRIFEQRQADGALDARGVLIVLSAASGGYALCLGEALAKQEPELKELLYSTVRFAQGRHAAAVAAWLDVLGPQAGHFWPVRPDVPRKQEAVLDIEAPGPPPG
ncbi:hypothetical protein [Pyxidicoccus xibeiensis]|uniref:hypothetical protein n=1 Tax=Pyxidicoccus xibeiensis TaxID=2906759 RepID=UPI0020A7BD4C|nr:hypothetical protein [Pyxidicoccus xibeiensis]MCP3137742.1 hypothetical protein [Pyxidicoccus xibeiensis]